MRVVARDARALEGFEPRLIGSVSTGHIRKGSDVDLHVFTDDRRAPAHVKARSGGASRRRRRSRSSGEIREYLHVHVKEHIVELTLYERRESRFRLRSSTDGKLIARVKPAALEAPARGGAHGGVAALPADGVIEGWARRTTRPTRACTTSGRGRA